MHFIQARDALMQGCNLNRRLATLAVRIARGVDDLEIIAACTNFGSVPLLTREEWNTITELIKLTKGEK